MLVEPGVPSAYPAQVSPHAPVSQRGIGRTRNEKNAAVRQKKRGLAVAQ